MMELEDISLECLAPSTDDVTTAISRTRHADAGGGRERRLDQLEEEDPYRIDPNICQSLAFDDVSAPPPFVSDEAMFADLEEEQELHTENEREDNITIDNTA